MSDVAPGSVSLEDDNSAQFDAPPPTPEAPAATPPEPVASEDTEPEGVVVNPNGEKLVPLNVVADLRGKVRETKSALEAKDAEIAALKDIKAKYDQVAGEWQAVQPLIQQLKNQPPPPPATPKPAGPLSPQDAIEYAKDLDLYKADGTPDVDRAQRLAARQQTLAQQSAQQLVQPIYAHTAQQQSRLQLEQMAQMKGPNGIAVDRGTLEQIWGMIAPEMSARPEVAAMLWRQALAETVLNGKYKAPVTAPPPPVQTESLGGTAPVRELSQIDRNMMQAATIKPKEYETISANFKPGQSNSLE